MPTSFKGPIFPNENSLKFPKFPPQFQVRFAALDRQRKILSPFSLWIGENICKETGQSFPSSPPHSFRFLMMFIRTFFRLLLRWLQFICLWILFFNQSRIFSVGIPAKFVCLPEREAETTSNDFDNDLKSFSMLILWKTHKSLMMQRLFLGWNETFSILLQSASLVNILAF